MIRAKSDQRSDGQLPGAGKGGVVCAKLPEARRCDRIGKGADRNGREPDCEFGAPRPDSTDAINATNRAG